MHLFLCPIPHSPSRPSHHTTHCDVHRTVTLQLLQCTGFCTNWAPWPCGCCSSEAVAEYRQNTLWLTHSSGGSLGHWRSIYCDNELLYLTGRSRRFASDRKGFWLKDKQNKTHLNRAWVPEHPHVMTTMTVPNCRATEDSRIRNCTLCSTAVPAKMTFTGTSVWVVTQEITQSRKNSHLEVSRQTPCCR